MSSSRPKLSLDEQSFQDMLAAAFTIQEHNARRKKEAQPPARACGQCGAPLAGKDEGPLCQGCSAEPRPGEELQRKWASLWLMSQEQGVFPDRAVPPDEVVEAAPNFHREAGAAELPMPRFAEPLRTSEEDANETVDVSSIELASGGPSHGELVPLELALDRTPAAPGELRILPDVSELAGEGEVSDPEIAEETPTTVASSLRDLRLKLRFHRADLYLVVAVIVATFAMFWVLSATPALGTHQKPRLRLWERALISVGLAEAPEAPVRRGNPNISVWVDPKTALYYCAGEDLYGKAAGGHLATQREAQLDQFEPAGRVPCE